MDNKRELNEYQKIKQALNPSEKELFDLAGGLMEGGDGNFYGVISFTFTFNLSSEFIENLKLVIKQENTFSTLEKIGLRYWWYSFLDCYEFTFITNPGIENVLKLGKFLKKIGKTSSSSTIASLPDSFLEDIRELIS